VPGSSSEADPNWVPQPIREASDGQRAAGGTPNSLPGELADRPGWLLDKAREEDWGTAEWLRWERLRTRFVYLHVEPSYSDEGVGCLSCSWLDDTALGLPTISSVLRADDP
jgi:hypothetical protein